MKTVYFSHDRDARSDPKVIKLRMQYGMEGYGCYFALLEMMFSESDYSLPYDQEQFDAIAYDLRTASQAARARTRAPPASRPSPLRRAGITPTP